MGRSTFVYQYVFQSIVDWVSNVFTLSGAAYAGAIGCYLFQTVSISVFLARFVGPSTLVTLAADVPLLVHLIWFWRQENAHRATPIQWLVYSWVHAAKTVGLCCNVMPFLQDFEGDESSALVTFPLVGGETPTWLFNILLLTPVFYALLMFRCGLAIFGTHLEHITADVIMHVDMLWHVVMDMIDIIYMIAYTRAQVFMEPAVITRYATEIRHMQSILPILLFMAIMLHAQSLPGVVCQDWNVRYPDALERKMGRLRSLDVMPAAQEDRDTHLGGLSHLLEAEAVNPSRRVTQSVVSSESLVSTQPASEEDISPQLNKAESGHVHTAASSIGKIVTVDKMGSENTFSDDGLPRRRRVLQRFSSSISGGRFTGTLSQDSSSHESVYNSLPRTMKADHRFSTQKHRREVRRQHKQFQVTLQLIARHSVVAARIRSAFVSIFFVDIPFLLIRCMLFYFSFQVAEPEFSALVMKNGLCLLMNLMQFQVLNKASEEAEGEIHKLIGGRNSRVGVVPMTLPTEGAGERVATRNSKDDEGRSRVKTSASLTATVLFAACVFGFLSGRNFQVSET